MSLQLSDIDTSFGFDEGSEVVTIEVILYRNITVVEDSPTVREVEPLAPSIEYVIDDIYTILRVGEPTVRADSVKEPVIEPVTIPENYSELEVKAPYSEIDVGEPSLA